MKFTLKSIKMFVISRRLTVGCLKNISVVSSLRFTGNKAFFSTQSGGPSSPPVREEVLLYQGQYSGKMKWLRRISLTSAIMGTVFLPISLVLESGIIPIVAQAGVMGILCLFSASSTAILQVVGHPYVATIHELLPPLPANEKSAGNPIRRFKASKYSVTGKLKYTEFVLSDVSKQTLSPFASCRIEKVKGDFYVFGGPSLKDDQLRDYMTREGVDPLLSSIHNSNNSNSDSSNSTDTVSSVIVPDGEASQLDSWKDRRNKKDA